MKHTKFLACLGALAAVSALCGALLYQKRLRQKELFDFMAEDDQKTLVVEVPEKKEPGLYMQFESYTSEMVRDLKKLGMDIVQEAEVLEVKWSGEAKVTAKRLMRQLKRLANKYKAKLLTLEYISPNKD